MGIHFVPTHTSHKKHVVAVPCTTPKSKCGMYEDTFCTQTHKAHLVPTLDSLDVVLVVLSKCAPVAQLVEHRAAMREVVSSTPAGPTLRVLNN